MEKNPLIQIIEDVVAEHNCDVYLYAGQIDREICDSFIATSPECPKPQAIVMLSTYGGDLHAAYRLTPHLHDTYDDGFTLFVPTMCKSAGTLVAIGAQELVMSPDGELGPLDVQVLEPDEVGEYRSGLIPSKALETIREEAFVFFADFLSKLRGRSPLTLSTGTASEIASQLTIGLLKPLVAQIDPLRVANIRLSMRIAAEYGKRLSTDNVNSDTLQRLIYQYPSHGYIIDRSEAEELFVKVRGPTMAERDLAIVFTHILQAGLNGPTPIVTHLSGESFLHALTQIYQRTKDEDGILEEQGEKNHEHKNATEMGSQSQSEGLPGIPDGKEGEEGRIETGNGEEGNRPSHSAQAPPKTVA